MSRIRIVIESVRSQLSFNNAHINGVSECSSLRWYYGEGAVHGVRWNGLGIPTSTGPETSHDISRETGERCVSARKNDANKGRRKAERVFVSIPANKYNSVASYL